MKSYHFNTLWRRPIERAFRRWLVILKVVLNDCQERGKTRRVFRNVYLDPYNAVCCDIRPIADMYQSVWRRHLA